MQTLSISQFLVEPCLAFGLTVLLPRPDPFPYYGIGACCPSRPRTYLRASLNQMKISSLLLIFLTVLALAAPPAAAQTQLPAPTGLTADTETCGRASITWTAIPQAAAYQIQTNTARLATASSPREVRIFPPGIHDVRVRAIDKNGHPGEWSQRIGFTVHSCPADYCETLGYPAGRNPQCCGCVTGTCWTSRTCESDPTFTGCCGWCHISTGLSPTVGRP